MLKVQQLLHICSEHYEAKEKEEDKDKKDKKDKEKKEAPGDMGSHQVSTMPLASTHTAVVVGERFHEGWVPRMSELVVAPGIQYQYQTISFFKYFLVIK